MTTRHIHPICHHIIITSYSSDNTHQTTLIRSQVQNASNQAMMAKGNLSNQIKNKVGALNSQIGMAKQQAQQAIGDASNQANSGFGSTMFF